MLFGLFSKKDHRHYQNQAAKHLAADRFADARIDFLEALRLCPADAEKEKVEIQQGLDHAGNRLGEMNLQEGEHSLRAGELQKAYDHFVLAADLAVDISIKSRAEAGLASVQQPAAPAPEGQAHQHKHKHEHKHKQAEPSGGYKQHGGGSCTSCGTHGHSAPAPDVTDTDLSEEDQFHLMVAPLPGDLPARYAALGPKFAKAYMLIHDGNDRDAFPILQEMLLSGENDIVFYEVALIMFRAGQIHESENLLKRAVSLNPTNAVCYLALVQLLAGAGRYPEAIATLERMVELDLLADQAQFMMGELYEMSGDENRAFEIWSKVLEMPAVAKSAAERLVPILQRQGRMDDVKYLTKKYLKGCC